MKMINSRKELYSVAKNMYKSLLTRTAERYFNKEQYVISDHVGYCVTQIEELFRPLWGIAPFLKEGDLFLTVNGKEMSAVDFINTVMIEGSSENGFDKDITDFNRNSFANQAITEVAAYLVTVYFAPETLWDVLDKEKQDQIALWVKKWAICALQNSWPNNHYWYPIFCIEILKKLGYDMSETEEDMKKGYDFLETLYIDKGWYCDGAFGRFDYYEAWAHHTYPLLWILLADMNDPENVKRADKYRARSSEFLKFFINYFDSDGGMAAYGRSIGYRFGCVAPFGLAALTGCDFNLGQAKRVILKNINYFFENSIPTKDGIFPVGYLYETPGFGENYATDGAISCYTEGFMCLLADENHPLWQSEEELLPIEKGNYGVSSELDGLDIQIHGDNEKNGVTLYNNSIHYYQAPFFGNRFNDMGGYYGKFAYNSRSGFGISTADNVSLDNMIGLYTLDGSMTSHRKKILDYRTEDGIMISSHIPFANDEKTVIKTYLLPLSEGWHLRVHKVTLAQKYIVFEGGFSIGLRDDAYVTNENNIVYGNVKSTVISVSNVESRYCIHRIHPGMHLLQPQAIYPAYMTGALNEGDYLFATLACFTTDGKEQVAPEVTLDGNKVTVKQNSFVKTFTVE